MKLAHPQPRLNLSNEVNRGSILILDSTYIRFHAVELVAGFSLLFFISSSFPILDGGDITKLRLKKQSCPFFVDNSRQD